MPRDAIYRHTNDIDILYATILTTGEYDATDSIIGDNSEEPKKYVFANLADDTTYEVRIRVGPTPVETDPALGGIPAPELLDVEIDKEDIREALNGKWLDLTKPTLVHNWQVTDYDIPTPTPEPGDDLISNAE